MATRKLNLSISADDIARQAALIRDSYDSLVPMSPIREAVPAATEAEEPKKDKA